MRNTHSSFRAQEEPLNKETHAPPKRVVDIYVNVVSIPARAAVNRIVGISASDREEFRIRFSAWVEAGSDTDFLQSSRIICIDPGIPTWIELRVPGMSLSRAAEGACAVLRAMGYVPRQKLVSSTKLTNC